MLKSRVKTDPWPKVWGDRGAAIRWENPIRRSTATVLAACGALVGGALAGAGLADAAAQGVAVRYAEHTRIAPGVEYQDVSFSAAQGQVNGHLISIDLRAPHVSVDLLHGASVTDRQPVSQLADAQGAIAGVNGDFFNISETSIAGVEPTGASVGPAVARGGSSRPRCRTASGSGPALPPGATLPRTSSVSAPTAGPASTPSR